MVVNRAAIVLKYRPPAVQWINEADPIEDDPGVTMESVNDDLPVYLVGDEDADSDETLEEWIRSNFQELFESELEGWYTDPDLWPADRNFDLFKKWFDVECHTVLLDTVGGPIVDDEA